jgi:hypothetical protein
MSAVNIFVLSDGSAGYMLTDSLATEEFGGQILHFPKALAIPHSRTVVALRGHSSFIFSAFALAGKGDDFDTIAAEWRQSCEIIVAAAPPSYRNVEFYVMGWSESAKRVRTFWSIADSNFTPQFVEAMVAPGCEPEQVMSHDLGGPLTWSDPSASLLRITKMQREKAASGYGAYYGRIGGIATLTTLTRDRIEQRIVHRWDEDIQRAAKAMS